MSTRNYQPGDGYGIGFTTKAAGGAMADADSLPAAALYHNGSVDGSVTVTVTHNSTGDYSANCTLPGGYAAGDRCSLKVTATIGGIATGEYVDHIRLVGWPSTALPNAAAGASGGVPLGDGSGRVTITQAFPANFASLAIASGTGFVSIAAGSDPFTVAISTDASGTSPVTRGNALLAIYTALTTSQASCQVVSGSGTTWVVTAPSIATANLVGMQILFNDSGTRLLKAGSTILGAQSAGGNVILTLATPIVVAAGDPGTIIG